MVRHILGISGGKDSAALAIYLKKKYPQMKLEYYNTDTGCELAETELLINRLDTYLGGITMLRAAAGSPEPTPFEHFLKASGIRGDEDREGYVSTKPNIQAIFPFRKNIWSADVVNKVLNNNNIANLLEIYTSLCGGDTLCEAKKIIEKPLTKNFYYSKKTNALLDLDVKLFNKAVFKFLKTTDYPVGKLDEFPLVDNDDILVRDDIFRILEESGVGVPDYYKPIKFEVDGKVGTYNRSRSGCYFCFFQQKIEWIWLYEQHPDLYKKAMEFEKGGYTWNQNESLADLIKPERIRQIKLDAIKKQEAKREAGSCRLVDNIGDIDEDNFCANCFI